MCENCIKYPLCWFGVFHFVPLSSFITRLQIALFFDVKNKYINLKIIALQNADIPENAFYYR